MTISYGPRLSRRTTLQWIAASSLAPAWGRWTAVHAGSAASPSPVSQGYGTDPNLNNPVVPWSLIMEPHQLQQTAVLADLILPGSATAPAPSAVGIPEFVNEWVSAPYPDQVHDRGVILDGLRWLDAESVRRSQHGFLEADDVARKAILVDIAAKQPAADFVTQSPFFQRFRFLVVGGYYTTPEGFKDIGYIGNVPLASYPPVTDEERQRLDAALSKLDLPTS